MTKPSVAANDLIDRIEGYAEELYLYASEIMGLSDPEVSAAMSVALGRMSVDASQSADETVQAIIYVIIDAHNQEIARRSNNGCPDP